MTLPDKGIETQEQILLKNRDMLCFGHDWNGDPLSKTHLMKIFARNNRVLWINSIGYRTPKVSRKDLARVYRKLKTMMTPLTKAESNIYVLSPLVIPVHNKPVIQRINRVLLKFQIKAAMWWLGFKKPLNWVFYPTASIVSGELGEDKLIYYCADEFTAMSEVASASLVELEQRLMKRADMVFVSANNLYSSKEKWNPNTFLIRHGVDYSHFKKALDPKTRVPIDIANLPHPIIGYFGLMATDWFDLELMLNVAKSFPEGSIVLLGNSTMDISRLTEMPNVHYLGRKPYDSLPAYSKGFDVGLIPFPINNVTLNANPLKAREYLAAGVPVVSTRIPEVEHLGLCRIATDQEDMAGEIKAALADSTTREARSLAMQTESWESRVEEISRHFLNLQ